MSYLYYLGGWKGRLRDKKIYNKEKKRVGRKKQVLADLILCHLPDYMGSHCFQCPLVPYADCHPLLPILSHGWLTDLSKKDSLMLASNIPPSDLSWKFVFYLYLLPPWTTRVLRGHRYSQDNFEMDLYSSRQSLGTPIHVLQGWHFNLRSSQKEPPGSRSSWNVRSIFCIQHSSLQNGGGTLTKVSQTSFS